MKHHLSIAALSAILTACSSGSDSSSAFNAQVTGITGIHYQIDSRRGLVEQGTNIEYHNGDEITFSLGQVELATITAKEQISLEDLFPQLPETAKDFRTGLRQYYYVSTRLQTSSRSQRDYRYGAQPVLHRASNIMQLLIAMDADGNAANGIDLITGEWPAKLAEFNENTLPLNIQLASFSEHPVVRAFSQKYNLPLNTDIAAPLDTLYQLVGKTISVKPVIGYTTPDISPMSTVAYSFTPAMQLETQTTTRTGLERSSGAIYKTTLSYDAAGNITKNLYETDSNGDGSRDRHNVRQYTFNDYGTLLTNNYQVFNDSNSDATTNTTTTYTAKDGKALRHQYRTRNELNNTSGYVVNEYSYNDQGLLTQDKSDRYDAGDGLLGTAKLYTYTYNDDGSAATSTQNSYSNTTFNGKTETTYSYSDKQAQATELSYNRDNELNIQRSVFIEKFDDQNRLAEKILELQSTDDNSVRGRQEMTFLYDSQGRLESCTLQNYNADSEPTFKSRERKIYDENGITSAIYESAVNAADDFTVSETSTFTYGDDGRMLSESNEIGAHYTYADDDAANGVAYLVHEMMLIDDEILGNSCFVSKYR